MAVGLRIEEEGSRGGGRRTSRRRRAFCQRSRRDDRSLDAAAATCRQLERIVLMLSI